MGRGRGPIHAARREHPAGMIEPLRMSFEVGCSAEHAFATWTSDISSWWPEDHTVTAEAGLEVVLEPGVGGRIYERTRAGAEHDWGQVTAWEPPARLGYLWHLRRDRASRDRRRDPLHRARRGPHPRRDRTPRLGPPRRRRRRLARPQPQRLADPASPLHHRDYEEREHEHAAPRTIPGSCPPRRAARSTRCTATRTTRRRLSARSARRP